MAVPLDRITIAAAFSCGVETFAHLINKIREMVAYTTVCLSRRLSHDLTEANYFEGTACGMLCFKRYDIDKNAAAARWCRLLKRLTRAFDA